MRRKTEERRDRIVSEAAALFRERGFDRVSMAEIARAVGGSKATLYSYFGSKDELFASVMTDAVRSQASAILDLLDPNSTDLREDLTRFGRAYISLLASEDVMAINRIGMSDTQNPDLRRQLYEIGPHEGMTLIAEHLQRWISRGMLVEAPGATVAAHLRGLLESEIIQPRMFGAPISAARRERAIAAAIDVFLRAYGTASAA